MTINKYLAEAVGTFILVFVGSMSVLAAIATDSPVMVAIPLGKKVPQPHLPSASWAARSRAPQPLSDPRTLRGDLRGRCVGQVSHRLPADGWIGVEQPFDHGHAPMVPQANLVTFIAAAGDHPPCSMDPAPGAARYGRLN